MTTFSHLHCHTQFSLLDGAASISSLYQKAVADQMPAIAITDHGNMFGVFKFVAEAQKHNTPENPNKIKPIVGCEFYLVEDRFKKEFTKEVRDVRCHQLFLAKNAEGYANLVKLCSAGYTDGLYGKYPRIDKERHIVLAVDVLARSVDDVNRFMENLEASGAFTHILARAERVTDAGQLEVALEATYLVSGSAAEPDKTAAAAGAARTP